MVKIEAGKYYKTRDGIKVGPIRNYDDRFYYKASFCCGNWTYLENGKWAGSTEEDNRDIIAEWQDQPSTLRIVTRREVVPGTYGIVQVTSNREIKIQLGKYSADKLREAAHILNQIAEALEDGTTL